MKGIRKTNGIWTFVNVGRIKTQTVLLGGIFTVWALLLFFLVQPVIRESDQASFILGAWKITSARTAEMADFYMVSKAFAAYWFYSIPLSLFQQGETQEGLESMIKILNGFQALFFASCVLAMILLSRSRSDYNSLLLGVVLFSPVVLFSAPFLACAILSAGFLILLTVALSRWEKASCFSVLTTCVLCFLAVGTRNDAILALPGLWFLTNKAEILPRAVFSFKALALLFGAAGALVFGRVFFPDADPLPEPFFAGKAFAGFFFFSAGAIGLCFLLYCRGTWRVFRIDKNGYRLAASLLVFLPFLFYSLFLFSPRYFLLSAIVILASGFGHEGVRIWNALGKKRRNLWRRLLVGSPALLTAGLWLVGLNIDKGLRQGNLTVFSMSSLYPTADGVWPMGGFAHYYFKLSQAHKIPLDHNQMAWDVWDSVVLNSTETAGKVDVRVAGTLNSLGTLKMSVSFPEIGLGRGDDSSIENKLYLSRHFLRGNSFSGVDRSLAAISNLEDGVKIGGGSGYWIIGIGPDFQSSSPQKWQEELRRIRSIGGGDFGFLRIQRWRKEEKRAGYYVVLFSEKPFIVGFNNNKKKPQEATRSGSEQLYASKLLKSEEVDWKTVPMDCWGYRSEYARVFSIRNFQN